MSWKIGFVCVCLYICVGYFLLNSERFQWKKHCLILFHALQLWFFQKERALRPYPYVPTQLCAQLLAVLSYGTLSKMHNPISNISHLPKTWSDSWEITVSFFLLWIIACTWHDLSHLRWIESRFQQLAPRLKKKPVNVRKVALMSNAGWGAHFVYIHAGLWFMCESRDPGCNQWLGIE